MKNTNFLKKILLSLIGIGPVKGMENDNSGTIQIPIKMDNGHIMHIQYKLPKPEFRTNQHVIHICESDKFAEQFTTESEEEKLQKLIEKQKLQLIETQNSIEVPKLEVIKMPVLPLKPITIQNLIPVQEEIQESYQENNAMKLEQQDKFDYHKKRFDNSVALVAENRQKDRSVDSLILQMNERNQRSYIAEQELLIQNQTDELKTEMEQMQLLNAQHEEKIKQEMNITSKALDTIKIQVEEARAQEAMLMLQANSDNDIQQPQSCCCIIF